MKRLMMTSAHAGTNTCEGTVNVDHDMTTVVGEYGSFGPNGCRFPTASKLGRRILAACPNGSQCMIDVEHFAELCGDHAPIQFERLLYPQRQ
jgi:hypothetical protein